MAKVRAFLGIFLLSLISAASFGQSFTPAFVQAQSRTAVSAITPDPLSPTFALVASGNAATATQLEIYRYYGDSTSSADGTSILTSTLSGKWHRVSLSTPSGSSGGGNSTNLINAAVNGVTTRNDQSDYLVTDIASSTTITLDWTNATAFVNLAHNTTVSWADFPTSTTLARDFVLWLTNSGSFTASFGTINSQAIKWRTYDANAPTLPANALAKFIFSYDRTNYWGEMDSAPVGIGSLVAASQAQGDILYFDGAVWNRLAAGTSGNFLKTQGAGANPTWAAASGGGGLTTNNAVYPLSYFYTPIGPSNTTSEVTIFTNTIPAGALSTNRSYVVELTLDVFNNSGSGQTLYVQVYLGGTKLYEDSCGTIGTSTSHQIARLYFSLQALGSTSSQIGLLHASFGGVGTSSTGLGEFNTAQPIWAGTMGFTSSKDSSSTIPVDIHIQPSAANAAFALKCMAARDRIE